MHIQLSKCDKLPLGTSDKLLAYKRKLWLQGRAEALRKDHSKKKVRTFSKLENTAEVAHGTV